LKLSVVSPTYNEALNIPLLINKIDAALVGIEHEILIVDDNSPDRTWEVAQGIATTNPHVRVVRRYRNRGLGPAVIDGFSLAHGDVVACIDADLQHDAGVLPQMLRELESGGNIVIGSRYANGGGTGDWNQLRRLESRVATKMARALLGVKVSDPMSGYFLMRKKDFDSVRNQLNAKGFKILLEIIAKLHPADVREVPYEFRSRMAGNSKLSGRVVFEYLGQLWRLSKLGRYSSGRRRVYPTTIEGQF
jgi:dolichol-phosphate mannosyltransferase